LTGIKRETLQNWVKRGLVTAEKAAAGKGKPRQYGVPAVTKVHFLTELIALGIEPGAAASLFARVEPLVTDLAGVLSGEKRPEAAMGGLFAPHRVYRAWIVRLSASGPVVAEFEVDDNGLPLAGAKAAPLIGLWLQVDVLINGWVADALRFVDLGRPDEEAWWDILLKGGLERIQAARPNDER
jgi:hypothetical protein